MQPPQGYDPQMGFPGGQDEGGTPPWNQLPKDQQWVRRPIPGQPAAGQPAYGQVPPPAQIAPEPGQAPPYVPTPGMQEGPWQGQNPMMGSSPLPPQQSIPNNSGQGGYQPPKTGMPRRAPKRGQGGYILLAVAVIGLAAFLVYKMLVPGGAKYGYVTEGAMSSLYSGDAVLVRSEIVVTQESVSQIDFEVEEGKQVTRGDLVATTYNAGFNSKEWVTLNNYRNQIKEYHKILITGSSTDSTLIKRLEEVKDRAMEVQRLVQGAWGSVSNQETLLKEAMQRQQIYIKQKNPDDQKLSRLYDDENTQIQRISTWTKQFAATADGYVSFYTDGYEKGLNMSTYTDFTPAQVRRMYNGQAPEVESTVSVRNVTDIYRMVKLEPWALLLLCDEKSQAPLDGQTFHLVIESYDRHVLSATVVNSTRSGGELLVRLLIEDTDFLEEVLYLRTCHVTMTESAYSLMVPSNAIYIQEGSKGVVMGTEGGDYWTPVEVLYTDGAYTYIKPENPGVLVVGMPVRLF